MTDDSAVAVTCDSFPQLTLDGRIYIHLLFPLAGGLPPPGLPVRAGGRTDGLLPASPPSPLSPIGLGTSVLLYF